MFVVRKSNDSYLQPMLGKPQWGKLKTAMKFANKKTAQMVAKHFDGNADYANDG